MVNKRWDGLLKRLNDSFFADGHISLRQSECVSVFMVYVCGQDLEVQDQSIRRRRGCTCVFLLCLCVCVYVYVCVCGRVYVHSTL